MATQLTSSTRRGSRPGSASATLRATRLTFLRALILLIVCPSLLAALGAGSAGVAAVALPPRSATASSQWSAEAAQAKSQADAVAAQASFTDSTASSYQDKAPKLQSRIRWQQRRRRGLLSNATADAVEPVAPGPRWGHTAAYLPAAQIIMFVGGQVPASSDIASGLVTNDVFALDVSALSSSSNNNAASTAAQESWTRISSAGLPPHAFAARAVTHAADHSDERLWIVGGATNNCTENAPLYSWQAPSGSQKAWRQGTWSAPAVAEGARVPTRRRGARALQVPVELGMKPTQSAAARMIGGTSFMVLGGTADASTCGPATANSSVADYFGMDVWSAPTINNKASITKGMTTRSLALDERLSSLATVDYATVLLPANATAGTGDRVLFIGGRDSSRSLADMAKLWVLDLGSGQWQSWNATSAGEAQDLPAGRVGHSASRMPDGRVLMHGGFMQVQKDGETRTASNEAFVLDLSVEPARWSRVTGAGVAPARAFHTAVWVGDVLVVGFGQGGDGVAPAGEAVQAAASAHRRRDEPPAAGSGAVHYLDTGAPGGWAWSDSILAVQQRRKQSSASELTPAVVSSAAQPNAAAQNAAAPAPAADAGSSNSQASSSESKAGTNGSATAQQGSSNAVSHNPAPAAEGPKDAPPAGSGAAKSGAIAGGILGAAALAATVGGLYAAHKRRQAAERDDDGLDMYRTRSVRGRTDRGPPVSSLWLSQPMAWAASASKGLKRRASSSSSEAYLVTSKTSLAAFGDDEKSSYTVPAAAGAGFEVLRNVPRRARLSMRRQEQQTQAQAEKDQAAYEGRVLPNSFITALVSDDADAYARDNVERTVGGEGRFDAGYDMRVLGAAAFLTPPEPAVVSLTRAPSSESLGSVGSISHFSYPYLSAMHRPSLANLSPGATLSAPRSPDAGMLSSASASPCETLRRASRANGQDSWTRAAEESRNAVYVTQDAAYDSDEEAERLDTLPYLSASPIAAACVSSPLFPWEATPSFAASPRHPIAAHVGTTAPLRLPLKARHAGEEEAQRQNRAKSSKRARRSMLRVINAAE